MSNQQDQQQSESGSSGKAHVGFAAMDSAKQHEIASKGGHASAEKAGHEGMAERGRKGGESSGAGRRQEGQEGS
jgi:general stress protein YciG